MKASITLAFLVAQALLAVTAPAQAKLAPFEAQVSESLDNTTINSGASGALLEAAYFSAPQPFAAGRIFPCRLQVRMFDKTRLAASCN